MNIIIIEDEKPTSEDLIRTIKAVVPSATIIKVIASVEEGKQFFKNPQPIDLIFSDIHLGDGLSFEIFGHTKSTTPIIFCTAFDEYALQAFKNFGIDYILKPISRQGIADALDKYLKLSKRDKPEQPDLSDIYNQLKNQLQPPAKPSIILHQADKIIPLEGDQIALFFIENEIVYAYTFDQKKIATQYTLDTLEKKFSPRFFRSNRQYLINRSAIKQASQHFHRKLQIHLTVPFQGSILVGKEKANTFLDWLSSI